MNKFSAKIWSKVRIPFFPTVFLDNAGVRLPIKFVMRVVFHTYNNKYFLLRKNDKIMIFPCIWIVIHCSFLSSDQCLFNDIRWSCSQIDRAFENLSIWFDWKVLPLYVFRYALIVSQIKIENEKPKSRSRRSNIF